MSPPTPGINHKDLRVLLDAYKNTIEMNTILVQQQQQVVNRQDELINLQIKTMESLSAHSKDAVNNSITSMSEHNAIVNRLYVAMVGSGTIILSLIALMLNNYAKGSCIPKILDLLRLIALKLGVPTP